MFSRNFDVIMGEGMEGGGAEGEGEKIF